MIESVTFTTDFRCFKRGKTIRFTPGLNVLVGENGSGKSTLINAARNRGDAWKTVTKGKGPVIAWDAEKDNLRTQSFFDEHITMHVRSMFASHGQSSIMRLNGLFQEAQAAELPGTIIFDEPDAGLSLRNVATLGRFLNNAPAAGWQVIVATHHPDLIGAAAQVVDMDRGARKIKSATYLTRAREPAAG